MIFTHLKYRACVVVRWMKHAHQLYHKKHDLESIHITLFLEKVAPTTYSANRDRPPSGA